MKRLKTIISMICMLSVVLYSCKSEVDQESGERSEQSENYHKVTPDDIGDLKFTDYVLSDKAVDVTKDWLKFKELNNQIELLKTSDLSFFADDITLLEGFLTDLEAEIPEILKETSILVRLSALKTTIYKFEGSATLQRESKEAVLQSISDLLVAHSNLIFQINKKLEKDAQQIQKPQ